MTTKPVAVVLGASTGTGAAIARELSENHVVLGFHRGRHQEEADKLERETSVQLKKLDVGSSAACVYAGVETVYDYLHANYGRGQVTTFVHSLSGASVGTALGQTYEKVERSFALMAHSFLWWAQGLHERRLLAPDATLIALSNPVVKHYLGSAGVIGAAKAALEAYVKTLAVELGRWQHRVFAIRFGAVETPALEKVVGTASHLRSVHHYISPYRRMMTTTEVAQFVKLLATNTAASWALNGSIVDFDMGSTLTLLDYAFQPNK